MSYSNKVIFKVRALFDFPPSQELDQKNMLTFREGDKFSIIDKSGDEAGWWKAFDGRKIGYIPKNYVVPIEIS